MARVFGEARVNGREWTLVFREPGWWQRRLRVRGFFAGHDTKEELKAGITEQVRRLNDETEQDRANGKEMADLHGYLVPCDRKSSTRTTGLESVDDAPASPVPAGPTRLMKKCDKRLSLTTVRDVILADTEESEGSSAAASTTYSSPSATVKEYFVTFSACADVLRFRERSSNASRSQPSLPVLDSFSERVPRRLLLPAAAPGSLSNTTPDMDDGSSSSKEPDISGEIDNFVLHADTILVAVTTLPLYIDGVVTGGSYEFENVYLCGTVGSSPEWFKQRVSMWRVLLDPTRKPRFFIQTGKGAWLRLLNPNSEYRSMMDDLLVLGYFLNFVKRHPDASGEAAEQDLEKICSKMSKEPSLSPNLDRLARHIQVIRSFTEEDKDFENAPVLWRIFPNVFAKGNSLEWDAAPPLIGGSGSGLKRKVDTFQKREKLQKLVPEKTSQESLKTPALESYSYEDVDQEVRGRRTVRRSTVQVVHEEPSDGGKSVRRRDDASRMEHQRQEEQSRDQPRDDQSRDSVFTKAEVEADDPPICIMCDDGGNLLYCDGPCHRHFHFHDTGENTGCPTLRLSQAYVDRTEKYLCPNCKHKKQQCFICGKLGSSVPTLHAHSQVRCCDVRFCSRYYHVECAAEMVVPASMDWNVLADEIYSGEEKLYCPRHCCSVCGGAELMEPGKLVQCRRCPKAWHRNCLTNYARSKELKSTPIWDQHYRSFIYCRDHAILPDLQTPRGNHIKFP